MNRQRTPRRDDAVDRVRTIYWFLSLGLEVGSFNPRDVQRVLFPAPIVDAFGNVIKDNKFLGYSRGDHVPHADLVQRTAAKYPDSARLLNHVLWEVLRENRPAKQHARSWIGQLSPDIQKAVIRPSNQVGESSRTSDMLVRRFGLDSLAAQTVLFRMKAGVNESDAWFYACGIFRTLILMEPEFIRDELSTLVFELFTQRVFTRVESFWGTRFDLSDFNYPEKSRALRETARKIQYWDEDKKSQANGIPIRSPIKKNELLLLNEFMKFPISPGNSNSQSRASSQENPDHE